MKAMCTSAILNKLSDHALVTRSQYALHFRQNAKSGVLTIYMGKPEIPFGKSNGSLHPIWEALENMGCNLR